MIQVWHPYWLWEDYLNGMWRRETADYARTKLKSIIKFTGNHKAYGKAMTLVTKNWRVSCEHNLTNPGLNQKAWIGHAACCLAHGYPEYLVRNAWSHLTEEQQSLANLQAQNTITLWKEKYSRILRFGSKEGMKTEYLIRLPTNSKQMNLFQATDE